MDICDIKVSIIRLYSNLNSYFIIDFESDAYLPLIFLTVCGLFDLNTVVILVSLHTFVLKILYLLILYFEYTQNYVYK